jgi:hypothetical protein
MNAKKLALSCAKEVIFEIYLNLFCLIKFIYSIMFIQIIILFNLYFLFNLNLFEINLFGYILLIYLDPKKIL